MNATWLALACGGGSGLLSGEWILGVLLLLLGGLVMLVAPVALVVGAIYFLKWLLRVSPDERAPVLPPPRRTAPLPAPPPPPPSAPHMAEPPRYPRRVERVDAVTPTHAALETLWLVEAEEEHAEAGGRARGAMLLAAAGAPVELVVSMQQAATARLESARACVEVAGRYGRTRFEPGGRPELAAAEEEEVVPALVVHVLKSGCLMADFRADLAEAGAIGCEEPEARTLLVRIARECREYASLSWRVLQWLAATDAATTREALVELTPELGLAPRPRVPPRARKLLEGADAEQLRKAGRLPEVAWGALWAARRSATLQKLQQVESHA